MELLSSQQNSVADEQIEITLNAIENIIRKEDINVSFVVEHNGTVLGESSSTFVKASCGDGSTHYDVEFVVHLPVSADDIRSIGAVVSTPVLSKIGLLIFHQVALDLQFHMFAVKALYSVEIDLEDRPTASDTELKRKSIFTAKSGSLTTPMILGICNLDLIPIILGEPNFTEKLILEMPQFSYDGASVSWQNLPLLTVTVSQDDSSIFQMNGGVNFVNITVESMYNLPDSITDNMEYTAGSVVYIDSEVPENVFFENGAWTKYRDVERTKRWNTLSSLDNRARLSKYKLDCDYMGLKNEFKGQIDLLSKVCADEPRIEWNLVSRCILWKMGIEAMQNHIRRHKYWPFQFMMKQNGHASKSRGASSSKPQLYQCYVDVSELLFPGRKSCRVVGQLYTYSSTDIFEKVELEKNIFEAETRIKETKEKEKKTKTSKSQSVQSDKVADRSTPVTSSNEEPTVVVIEIELYEPLISCRVVDDFFVLISELIPTTEKQPPYIYSGDVGEDQYTNCVQKLAEIITESYRNFREEDKNSVPLKNVENGNGKERLRQKYCYHPESDELTCFTQYLYRTGVYLSLRSTLRSKVTLLLDQRFKMPPNLVHSSETQNFITSVYTYLVEQMHLAINKIVEGRYVEDLPKSVDSDSLYFYAEEAYEFGDWEKAKYYYTTVIMANKEDSRPWTKYAIFLKKIGHLQRAMEACLEAIALNRRDVIALLVYGGILFESQKYRESEIFLRAITELYPRFLQGWVILHLFYMRTEYCPGIDLTLRIAQKCMQDKHQEIQLYEEPLLWAMVHCPQDNIYMITATFLLKLHLCEFANIALAQELSNSTRSTHFLYYMAVEHYLSNRFEDALSHLEEAQCNYGMDYSISSLMGHCYFKIGNKKAIECYEFAHMLFDRPNDLHLVEMRLGYHYYNTEDYDRAKRMFLSACDTSPTAETWLGAGLSYFELGEFEDAETALSEANRLDNRNPDIWGYLCLLNITLRRYDEFSQCYREMVKNNLKNRKLWLRITNSMEALDYAPPIIVTESDDLIETHTEQISEEQFETVNGT
ncbi:cilia- and flagella-associated protein 70 isoform X2 [Andrena cerasifolii]|uniref:cilia- and flagella-associated protein 70 isoform X2 n=1 Tax=Andrena cerasifolii TaxID=2819439 RepID=UPI004037EC38